MSDNVIQQILRKVAKFPNGYKGTLSPFTESQCYKSSLLILAFSRSVSAVLRSARRLLTMSAPLRRIISRELNVIKPRETLAYSIYSIVDTLECGHTYDAYLFDGLRDLINAYSENPAVSAKQHRCRPCASLLAKKKPQSVPLPAIAKTA